MKANKLVLIGALVLGTAFSSTIISCQKMDRPEMVIIPDDTAKMNGVLQKYFAFENTSMDSIYYDKGVVSNVTYADGINGKAYKGGSNAMIVYPLGPKLGNIHSFTVSFWMKTNKHADGAEAVFTLPRTDDFWGNMFMLIESNGSTTDNSMRIKFNVAGRWWDFNNGGGLNRLPDAYGAWKHLVFSYDEQTSKFSFYLDGVKQALPAGSTDLTNNQGQPLGAGLTLTNPSKFVIGGYQQHAGIPSSNADGWMKKYTGMLDQFRFYTKALSDAEVTALFTAKK